MMASLISAVQSIRRIKNHTIAVRQCVMMLENIEMLLEHRNLSVDSIFDFLSKNDNFNQLKFIDSMAKEIEYEKDYEKVLSKALKTHENIKNFDSSDIELLKGYFSVIGKTDLSGQISNCRLYKEFFKQKLKTLEAEENIKCKSSSTFIVGTGVLLIIIII